MLAINTGYVSAILGSNSFSIFFTVIKESVSAGTDLHLQFESTSVSGLVHVGGL